MADINFEDIQPFVEGQGDTGKTAREKINRNFQKLEQTKTIVDSIKEEVSTIHSGSAKYLDDIITSDDVNVGDILYYDVIPKIAQWSINLYDGSHNLIQGIVVDPANVGQSYRGKIVIPEGFSYARNTRGNFTSCIIAKAGTLVGDSIAQYLMEERLEKAEDIIEKSDLASIGNLLCNGAVNYNGIYFSNDDVNEGDKIFYELIPRGSEFSIKIQYTNGEPETTIISTGNATAGETYRGIFLIPENFLSAKLTRGSLRYCKMAKAGTIGGDSVAQAMMGEKLEKAEDIIEKSDLASIGNLLCNGPVNYNGIYFSNDDVNEGDEIFYELIPRGSEFSIKIQYTNGEPETTIISTGAATAGETYRGIFLIPENFLSAKLTRGSLRYCKMAKAGTIGGDSVAQAMMGEKLEKAEDIIEKSDLASIGNLLCNEAVNYNGIYFSNDDVNEGDEIFYELIPRGSEFSIKIQYTNGEPETTIISTGAATAGETYRGKFVIPSNFSLAKLTRGNLKYCKMAKAGTIGGDSIAQAIMEEELESLKDDSNLPNYYKDYLDGMEAEIRNLQLDIQGEEDSFIFITDTHWIDNYKQSPAIIESLLKRGLTNKVVFGGDLMALRSDVNKATTDETREYIKTQIDFHRKFASSMLACGAKMFNVRGNHDINGIPAASGTSAEMWRANKKATQNILAQTLESTNGIKNVDGLNYVFDNDLKKIRYIIFDGYETSYRKYYNVANADEDAIPYGSSIAEFAQIPWVPSEIATIKAKFDIDIPSGYTEGNVAVKVYLGTKEEGQSEITWDLNSERRITSINGEQVLEYNRNDINKKVGICFGGNFNTARIRLTFAQNDSGEYLANALNWLASALTGTPSNYDIVVLCHYAATVATGSTFIPDFNRMLLAYNAKANTTINNTQYDFTSVHGQILAYVSGHTHKNLQSFSVGITHICSACDAKYSETPYMNEKPYSRAQGTVDEQLFDFIQIDKAANMIYCRRIGAGYDRYFHTQPKSITNGNSTTLLSTMLSGTLTWGCFDNDQVVTNTEGTQITSSRVRVSNGVVRGIAEGEAVVYAMDEKGNREFFEVIVN